MASPFSPREAWRVYQSAHAFYEEGRLPEAKELLALYEEATGVRTLRALLLQAYIERAEKRFVSAARTLQEALALFAGTGERELLADGWSLLGELLRAIGEAELSVEAFLQAAGQETDSVQALAECSNALFASNGVAKLTAERAQKLQQIYRERLARYVAEEGGPLPLPQWHHGRLRVGYLSADFRRHAVGQLALPLVTAFDPERFQVYAYSLVGAEDPVTARFRERLGANWRAVAGRPFPEIARQIRADEIDILVDLGGHTADNGLPVLGFRPAKLQLSGIGYMASTGLREVDGFLSDVHCTEASSSPYFAEPLLRLPHSHFCYAPLGAFPPVLPPPCLARGYVTFGSFNNFAKLTDEVLALWGQLLARVPGARLLLKHALLGTEEGAALARERMARAGIDLSRVTLRPYTGEYLAEYGDMDIALDPFPYPGGVTTLEALYMGVPVVTLAGVTHGQNFGKSLLENLGEERLVARTPAEYVELAASLAHDETLLGELRATQRSRLEASPLMDARLYLQDLEALYWELSEIWELLNG